MTAFSHSAGRSSGSVDTVEDTLDEMALFVQHPVNRIPSVACRILFDLRPRAQIIGDEYAQVIGVLGGIHDDTTDAFQASDQAACVRAVTPLAGRDREPYRQAGRIDRGVELCRQAAFGASDTGSFKPLF